eukprot:CAMPEP_0169460892 /NCGR_PEP_ID=MMETSP1042-20121227/18738_1 /TAXON_ID=464988 /ORGANISM="Hemiselmis andersenii, Strain CCMP1180" /LENGTH=537 /DNA_ID=CAMNT_0009573431 /DNA_START=2060 /DNA_END=3670 /DNA_ORIENTATION=+
MRRGGLLWIVVGVVAATCILSSQRSGSGWIVLEESGGMTYSRAEAKMHEAYNQADKFDDKEHQQRKYESQDMAIKANLLKVARKRADVLRAEDKRSRKVEGIRERLEDSLAATQQALDLHEKTLHALQAHVGDAERDAEGAAREAGELKASQHQMDGALDKLKSKEDVMRLKLQKETQEASDPKEEEKTEHWNKELQHYLKMKRVQEGKRQEAAAKASKSRANEKNKHEEALRQQQRADALQREVVLCGKKGACNDDKKRKLLEELADVKGQVSELEKEAMYQAKEAHIMQRTADLRATQEKGDGYRAKEYRSRLDGAYARLKRLKERVRLAPAALKTAELNAKLAEQSDERVKERVKIESDRESTDESHMRRDRALERVQERHISNLKPLEKTQERAVRTATSAAVSEDGVVGRESREIHDIMRKARSVGESGEMHAKVAQRWGGAALSELNEAKAYGEVAERLIGAKHELSERESDAFEAKQLRHGLQMMVARNALRRFRRDPSERNRAYLERVRGELYGRLGEADDAEQNSLGI